MSLDPQTRQFLQQLNALNLPSTASMTPAEAREMVRERSRGLPREAVASVRDHRVPVNGDLILVRTFTPAQPAPLPALVYFHGGGWVTGDVETHEAVCRTLANHAGCVVASVDFRRAPEFRFPTAAEDAYAATRWVADHAVELGADPQRLAVVGDSSGGNLAAVVALMARDRGQPRLTLQALIYPVTDCNFDTLSYRDNSEGYVLTRAAMQWFWDQYAPDSMARLEPYASPLRAPDLAGLAPALIVTAGYDPLRDEGEAYARRLTEGGVRVSLLRYPGLIHNFFRLPHVLDAARIAVDEVTDALQKALR